MSSLVVLTVADLIFISRFHLPSAKTFFQCRHFYPVWPFLSSVETFIQHEDFYLVRRLLSNVNTFIQCGYFHSV